MATDLDIARAATLKPINDIAAKAGIPAEALEPYGKYKAKIGLDFVAAQQDHRRAQGRHRIANAGADLGLHVRA